MNRLAYVGLGANLGRPRDNIAAALELLANEPKIELRAVSSLRETEPVGYLEQPRFVNAVAAVMTSLGPRVA